MIALPGVTIKLTTRSSSGCTHKY